MGFYLKSCNYIFNIKNLRNLKAKRLRRLIFVNTSVNCRKRDEVITFLRFYNSCVLRSRALAAKRLIRSNRKNGGVIINRRHPEPGVCQNLPTGRPYSFREDPFCLDRRNCSILLSRQPEDLSNRKYCPYRRLVLNGFFPVLFCRNSFCLCL